MDTLLLNTNSEIELLNAVFADQVEPVLRLTVKYDRHANLRVFTENVSLIKALNASTGTVGISADNLQNSIEVFGHTTGVSEAGKLQAIIIVSNPPLTVFSGGDIMMASYRVSNFCYLERLKTIQLQDEIHKFEYSQFDNVKDARSSTSDLKYELRETGLLQIKRLDAQAIEVVESNEAARRFWGFLTFVRGTYSGIGNLEGTDETGEIVANSFGYMSHDVFLHEASWFDRELEYSLSEIYSLFSIVSADVDRSQILSRVLEFYRSSNVARDSSLEMAVVASHAGLETFTTFVLKHVARWSNERRNDRRIQFSEKLKAAFEAMGVEGELFKHCGELQKRYSSQSIDDEFAFLIRFRNKIVHPNASFSYTGLELFEVWSVMQWLNIIFVFHLIGYRGQMVDFRRRTGWRGETVAVPLP